MVRHEPRPSNSSRTRALSEVWANGTPDPDECVLWNSDVLLREVVGAAPPVFLSEGLSAPTACPHQLAWRTPVLLFPSPRPER
jgi:hypothetical protein